MTPDRLRKAIGGIYDCAAGTATWEVCLAEIRTLFRGTSVNLLYNDHRSNRFVVNDAAGADPELYRIYAECGHQLDPWATRLRPDMIATGRIILGESLLPHVQVKTTDFYGVMGQRFETTRAVFGFLEASSLRDAILSVNRGDSGREFDAHDARCLSILLPHVRRALSIQRRLGTLNSYAESQRT